MASSTTASAINTVGSFINAGPDTINKVLLYNWAAGSTSSLSITAASSGLTYVYDAIATVTSGTYVAVHINTALSGTATDGHVKLVPAGSSDVGRVLIFGR